MSSMNVTTNLDIIKPDSIAEEKGDFTHKFNFSINHEFNISDDIMASLNKFENITGSNFDVKMIVRAIFNEIYLGGYELIGKLRDSEHYSLRAIYLREHVMGHTDIYTENYENGVLQVFLSNVGGVFPCDDDKLLFELELPILRSCNVSLVYDFIFHVFDLICSNYYYYDFL